MNGDLEYYQTRAQEEAEAASNAHGTEAASAHRLLSLQYDAQVREMQLDESRRRKTGRSPSLTVTEPAILCVVANSRG